MITTTVTNIVKQIKKLSPSEQKELRAVLNTLFIPTPALTEAEFHQRLVAEGRLSIPSPDTRSRTPRSFKPVPVKGKPISETIIEERR